MGQQADPLSDARQPALNAIPQVLNERQPVRPLLVAFPFTNNLPPELQLLKLSPNTAKTALAVIHLASRNRDW